MTADLTADAEVATAAPAHRSVRRRGLRRQAMIALAVMLALVASTGASSLISSHEVIGKFSSTATQLEEIGAYTAGLAVAISASEGLAHGLLGNGPVPRQQVLESQRATDAEFTAGLALLDEPGMRAALGEVRQTWRKALSDVGLLDAQVMAYTSRGDDGSAHAVLGGGSDRALAQLAVIDELARAELHKDLAEAQQFRRVAFAVVVVVVSTALLAMVYFARRMARDVLHPVEALRNGVGRVRAGELGHRVDLTHYQRENELTDLAAGFNEMAGELDTTHRELTFRALHDPLTGLPNRLALREHLSVLFANAGGLREQPDVSVLFIDLDDFKVVNDTVGHAGGDELLRQVAERLSACIRCTDVVGRLGGDEFAVVVTRDASRSAVGVAERALGALSAPFVVQGQTMSVSASIGVGLTRPETTGAEELLDNADFAMYMAKGQGKRRYEVYDPALHAATTDHAALRADLRPAVADGELFLDYQPVMDLASGTIVGVEALVRWNHPVRGVVSPLDFIPLAEETGDIDDIGLWVLRTATNQLARWRRSGEAHAALWVSVNISPVQLRTPRLVARLVEALAFGPVPADAVVLEVTESALVLGVDGAADAIQMLKDTGARVALDDFGTGLSSLSTLAGLPIDILKIDRAFVSGQDGGLPSTPVLCTVLAFAENLGLGVIAEGVEEMAQSDTLLSLGCELGQGFGLGPPAASDQITALLNQPREAPSVPAARQAADSVSGRPKSG